MGTILGDMFRKVGGGFGKLFDGEIIDGVGDVFGGFFDAGGRLINDALNIVGWGDEEDTPYSRFILCLLAMLSKMSKADGRVTKPEVQFLNSILDELGYDDETKMTLQQFCNEQKANVNDIFEFAECAVQAAAELSPDDVGFEYRVGAYRHLFLMAIADGELDDNEIALLRALPEHLGLNDEVFDLMAHELLGAEEQTPSDQAILTEAYAILGVSPDSSDAEVRRGYKKKIAAFHPDTIEGKDLAPEWRELANQQSAKINQAYETIMAARK